MGLPFQHLQCDWKLQRFTQQIQEYKMTNLESHSLHLPKVANIGPFGHRKDYKRIWVIWLANCARYPVHQKVDPSIPQVVRVTLVFII